MELKFLPSGQNWLNINIIPNSHIDFHSFTHSQIDSSLPPTNAQIHYSQSHAKYKRPWPLVKRSKRLWFFVNLLCHLSWQRSALRTETSTIKLNTIPLCLFLLPLGLKQVFGFKNNVLSAQYFPTYSIELWNICLQKDSNCLHGLT